MWAANRAFQRPAPGQAERRRSTGPGKAILSALSERDETAAICRDKQGKPEPDPDLRDTESVPLAETVEAFFEREVKRHVPDTWIDTDKRDPRTARSASSATRST